MKQRNSLLSILTMFLFLRGAAEAEVVAGVDVGESAAAQAVQSTTAPVELVAPPGSVVIDFEAFPGPDGMLGTPDDVPIVAPTLFVLQSTQITTQYAALGIEFLPDPSRDDQNEILNDSSFLRSVGSSPNLLSTFRALSFGPIEATFTMPVRELTMAIGLGDSTSVRPNLLEIFDASGQLIDSAIGSDEFVTLTSDVDIASFRVTATLRRNQAAIDDIAFVVTDLVDVQIDIKPGSDPNSINPLNRGVIPVAILGSDTFDVADVDVTTLAFGPSAASLAHRNGPHVKDANHDRVDDLLAHFRTEETGIAFGDTEACVTGELLDGTPFEGCDSIFTVPPDCGDGVELALLLPGVFWLHRRRRLAAA